MADELPQEALDEDDGEQPLPQEALDAIIDESAAPLQSHNGNDTDLTQKIYFAPEGVRVVPTPVEDENN